MGEQTPGVAHAVWRGALVGLALIVPITLLTALTVDAGPGDEVSGWRVLLFFLVLVAFGVAGAIGARLQPDVRFTVGILAGLGAFVLWLPVRAAIWWIRGDERGLFAGADAILRPGQLFTAALFAATLGLVGGMVGGARAARASGSS